MRREIIEKVLIAISAVLFWIASAPATCIAAGATNDWETTDKRVKYQVFQINVAIKARLKTGLYIQLADLSPRMHYPVFATTPEDRGFRVVGYGSCFPVETAVHDHVYFLTNRHVVDFGDGMLQECRRFFAAMRLHAERTRGFSDADNRFRELMNVVNLCLKKNLSSTERQMYESTIDSIWDTYDNHLSTKADPMRNEFTKYLQQAGVEGQTQFFVHAAGPASAPAINAAVYRTAANSMQPDLALLVSPPLKGIAPLQLDTVKVSEGQSVQAVGYPANARSDTAHGFYAPTFSTGRITRVMPGWIEFDAAVTKGDSGGALINGAGKAVGVIVRRATPEETTMRGTAPGAGSALSGKFATAIDCSSIRAFAPELFVQAHRK